jgi:hypothetical protein
MRRDAARIADFQKLASGIFSCGYLERTDAIELLREIPASAQARVASELASGRNSRIRFDGLHPTGKSACHRDRAAKI